MVWDAISDLLLGHWSDKTHSRLGRRHPFMYAALLILPFSFYALFNPVIEITDNNAFWYILVLAMIIRTGTTLFEVPSTAMLPDLEKDYDHRNKWLALRYAFGWYGGNGLHTLNFMFWVGVYGVAVQTGYTIYATVGACIIALVIILSALGTQKVMAALPKPAERFKFREIGREIRQIFQSVKNRNFAALFFYGLIVGIAGGLGTALYLYNTTYFLRLLRSADCRYRNRRHALTRYCLLGRALFWRPLRQKERCYRRYFDQYQPLSHTLHLAAVWLLAGPGQLAESEYL